MFPQITHHIPTQLDWEQILDKVAYQFEKNKDLVFKRQGQHQFTIQKRNHFFFPFEQKIFLAEVVGKLHDGKFIYTVGLKFLQKIILSIDSLLLGIISILLFSNGNSLVGFLVLLFLIVLDGVLYIRLRSEVVWLGQQVDELIKACVQSNDDKENRF